MRIAVIGAGLMGRAAVYDLAGNPDVQRVGVFDCDDRLAAQVSERYGAGKSVVARLDAGDLQAVEEALRGYDAAVSCVPYLLNAGLTRAAIRARTHLIDLGGNNDIVRAQLDMDEAARQAGVIVIPDCGLAPGMVSIITAAGVRRFDRVHSVGIRVGGIPQSPRPPLNYQLSFSAEGLINEYWEPCLVLEGGKKRTVNPMTGLETLEFDGVGRFEAFYTSGGTSTLPDTFEGRIDHLDYKTIRYPGHCRVFRAMLEIGLASRQPLVLQGREVEPRELFKALLEKNLTGDGLDMVLVRVVIDGQRQDGSGRIVYEIVDRQQSKEGLTAMMRTTAFPAAIIACMAASNQIAARGCIPQEVAVDPGRFFPLLKRRGINLVVRDRD